MNVFELNTAIKTIQQKDIGPETLHYSRLTMKIPSRHHKTNKKMLKASNAIFTTYESFSKDLKKFGFINRVQKNRANHMLPKQVG